MPLVCAPQRAVPAHRQCTRPAVHHPGIGGVYITRAPGVICVWMQVPKLGDDVIGPAALYGVAYCQFVSAVWAVCVGAKPSLKTHMAAQLRMHQSEIQSGNDDGDDVCLES